MQNDRKVLYMENTFGYADSGSPGTFSIPSSPFMRSRLGTPAIDSNLWHGLPIQTGDALGDAIGTINQNSNWRQSPTPTREVQTPYHYHDVQLSETDEALLPNDDTNDPSLSRTKAIHEGGSNSDITLCSPARGDSENYFSGREQEAELEELDLSSRRYKKRKTSIQNVSTQRQGRIDEPLFASDINREPLSSQSVSSTRDENMRMRSHLATEGSVESTFPSDNTLIGGRYRVVVVQSLKDGRFYDPRDLDDGALILGTDEKSTTGGSSASMLLAAMASSVGGSRSNLQNKKRQTQQPRKRAPPPYRLASDMPPPPLPAETDDQGELTAQHKGASTRVSIQAMVRRAQDEGIQFVVNREYGPSGSKKKPRRLRVEKT